MIMQTVELYDSVYIKKIDKPYVKLKSNLEWLPTDSRNLAYKAAEIIRERYKINKGVFIELPKINTCSCGTGRWKQQLCGCIVRYEYTVRIKDKQKKTC